jgi:hypothetical protein
MDSTLYETHHQEMCAFVGRSWPAWQRESSCCDRLSRRVAEPGYRPSNHHRQGGPGEWGSLSRVWLGGEKLRSCLGSERES